MVQHSKSSISIILASLVLALGIAWGGYWLGFKAKALNMGKQTVAVKGVAQMNAQSDMAEWNISLQAHGETFEQALENIRKERPLIDQFLKDHQLLQTTTATPVNIYPHFVTEYKDGVNPIQVQQGYQAEQPLFIRSKDLANIQKAHANIINLQAQGRNLSYGAPQYLITQLDPIKLQLISLAMKDARQRALEFIKAEPTESQMALGAMQSASQGMFSVMPVNGNDNDEGGYFDTSSLEKKVRLVTTVEYGIIQK
jgi:hypothetical protein